MAYATETDLKRYVDSQLLSELKTDSDGSAVDVTQLLEDASARVDSALLRGGYTLPLPTPYPPYVVQLTCRLVVRALYSRRPTGDLPEHVIRWLMDADAELEAIAARRVHLSQAAGEAAVSPAAERIPSVWDIDENV